ncbi:MAG: ankyrin repeat domain-containing protein [Spirochaetia bacterium]|nr:ankyrin repeat domain-containing protein [Spirochaetia bacterium]
MRLLKFVLISLVFASTTFGAAIHEAAKKGDLAEVTRLFKAGVNVNEKDQYGQTALMGAASRGQVEVVRFILKVSADVNVRDKSGRTALGWAVKKGQHQTADILRKAGGKE